MHSAMAGTSHKNKYFINMSQAAIPRSMLLITSPNFFLRCQSKLRLCKWLKLSSESCTKAACPTRRYTKDWASLNVDAANCNTA